MRLNCLQRVVCRCACACEVNNKIEFFVCKFLDVGLYFLSAELERKLLSGWLSCRYIYFAALCYSDANRELSKSADTDDADLCAFFGSAYRAESVI